MADTDDDDIFSGCDLARYNPDIDEIEDGIAIALGRTFRFTERAFWGLVDRFASQSVGIEMFDGVILTWEMSRHGMLVHITA